MPARGRFISLEGGEGAGKSTVLAALVEALRGQGIEPVVLREPGGTELGEAIRSLLLDRRWQEMCAQAELLLVFAARAQLLRERLQPALHAGRVVLCDRYVDASYAYQGGGRGLPWPLIDELARWTTEGLLPELTLLLDLPHRLGAQRAAGRGGAADRIELSDEAFFARVREAYLARAAAEPRRFVVIDASQPLQTVVASALKALRARFEAWP